MSLFEDAMAVAVKLPMDERERLAQALGVKTGSSGKPGGHGLPMAHASARPDPVAWRKAETGHAVLATGVAPVEFPPGPAALHAMWERQDDAQAIAGAKGESSAQLAGTLPRNSPVVVHTDVCLDLAVGVETALRFFEAPPVEIRLATATYLALLDYAEDETQQQRIRRFVQPYAVLSLGPMASSRAVELMLARPAGSGLHPLDALVAATALAHEIPLVTCDPRPFAQITGLEVRLPYVQTDAGVG